MRSLLDVIHTYEEMPSMTANAQQIPPRHSAGDFDWTEECHLEIPAAAARYGDTRDSSRSNSNSRDISPDAPRARGDSHNHSHNHSRDGRDRSALGEDFTHERALVMLEQIQASLRRDQHQNQEARDKA